MISLADFLSSRKNFYVAGRVRFPVRCADGFEISIQASSGHYCSPRYSGPPWVSVECGYPSERPVGIIKYAEDAKRLTDTVYGNVPIAAVERLLKSHGGIVGVVK